MAKGIAAVVLLVVEEDICIEGGQERPLGQAVEEERLINADIPGAQRPHHPFMGRGAAGGDQRRSQRRLINRKEGLDTLQALLETP